MVASHLDKGLVELEAGGGEGIEVGCVHGRGGDKRPINLVVGLQYTVHFPLSLCGIRTSIELFLVDSEFNGMSPDHGVPIPYSLILTAWT